MLVSVVGCCWGRVVAVNTLYELAEVAASLAVAVSVDWDRLERLLLWLVGRGESRCCDGDVQLRGDLRKGDALRLRLTAGRSQFRPGVEVVGELFVGAAGAAIWRAAEDEDVEESICVVWGEGRVCPGAGVCCARGGVVGGKPCSVVCPLGPRGTDCCCSSMLVRCRNWFFEGCRIGVGGMGNVALVGGDQTLWRAQVLGMCFSLRKIEVKFRGSDLNEDDA